MYTCLYTYIYKCVCIYIYVYKCIHTCRPLSLSRSEYVDRKHLTASPESESHSSVLGTVRGNHEEPLSGHGCGTDCRKMPYREPSCRHRSLGIYVLLVFIEQLYAMHKANVGAPSFGNLPPKKLASEEQVAQPKIWLSVRPAWITSTATPRAGC